MRHRGATVRTTMGLRDALFDALDDMRAGELSANDAIAIAKLAWQIINVAKIEIDYAATAAQIKSVHGDKIRIRPLRLGHEHHVEHAA